MDAFFALQFVLEHLQGAKSDFRRNIPIGSNPRYLSTELDMPRLDAPRGPARGRARANLRDLSTVCLSTILAARRAGRARAAQTRH
jgi:hypothetical protein